MTHGYSVKSLIRKEPELGKRTEIRGRKRKEKVGNGKAIGGGWGVGEGSFRIHFLEHVLLFVFFYKKISNK